MLLGFNYGVLFLIYYKLELEDYLAKMLELYTYKDFNVPNSKLKHFIYITVVYISFISIDILVFEMINIYQNGLKISD